MDELELVDLPEMVKPCPATEMQLESHGSERGLSLSRLKGPKGFCVWCAKPLTGRQQRWCSTNCVSSSQFRCYPQTPDAKMYRLIVLQNCACARCGLSFEEELRKRISEIYAAHNRVGKWTRVLGDDGKWRERTDDDPKEKISLYRIGYGTGDRWHTDHIVPVHLGGKGIDPNNLQVLCVPCHKDKTREDIVKRDVERMWEDE